jgi:hypothetical protein
MKTLHTPGPWDIRKIDSAPSFRGIFGVCANGGGNSIQEEEKANARLIAAAPDMLETLKDALRWINTTEYAAGSIMPEKLAHAIAQAEGQ